MISILFSQSDFDCYESSVMISPINEQILFQNLRIITRPHVDVVKEEATK